MTNYTPKHDWPILERYNLTVRVPHGYTTDPNDPKIFIPDLAKIKFYEEALDLIDAGHPSREVSDWLTSKIDRSISHQGIINIWKKYRSKDKTNPRAKAYRKRRSAMLPKTDLGKKERKARLSVQGAERALRIRKQKLDDLKAKEPLSGVTFSEAVEEPEDDREVIFRPHPGPQTEFLAAIEQQILYGGAAGGGKSYAMLVDPMRDFENPNFNGILFRKTNDELRELVMKSQSLYVQAFPGARWQEQKSRWVFPSGAQFWFTYLDKDLDVERYQGQAFTWIGFDELGHWETPYAWNYMSSRLRSTDPDISLSQRATANPGGLGGWWIKKMFINPAPPNQAFWATDIDSGETLRYPPDHKEHPNEPLFKRRFIPAKLSDNPSLYKDGRYEASLLSLPKHIREQLLYGNWDIMDGAAFSEFDANVHTIEPFKVPDSWKKFRSCDYGYASNTAVHWFTIDPVYETLIVYRELYTRQKTGKELARIILDLERNEKIQYGMLDSSVWHQRGQTGPSIAEEMIMEGCRWRPADRSKGSRVSGKNRLHELLKARDMGTNEDGTLRLIPGIQFFNTCRQIIADLPTIPTDPDGGDDIDVRHASDHTYDSIRYGIMSRPRAVSVFDFGGNEYGGNRYQPADKRFGY